MVDFIKANISRAIINPQAFEQLEFVISVNSNDGEVKEKAIAEFGSMQVVKWKTGTAIIKGSIHKHVRADRSNHDLFTYFELCDTINKLTSHIGIDPRKAYLQNLEWGVNLELACNVAELLSNLLLHVKVPFVLKTYPKKYYQAEHTAYFIKAYDKGKQYNLPQETLRFELKCLKNRQFSNTGIKTIADLMDINKLRLLHNDLIDQWNKVLLFEEPSQPNEIPPNIEAKLHQWSNPRFWTKLCEAKDVNAYRRNKRQYLEYRDKYTNNLHLQIANLIESRWHDFAENNTQLLKAS